MTDSISNITIAAVVVAFAASLVATFWHRFPHVGNRYRAAVIIGYVCALTTVTLLLLDARAWPDTHRLINAIRALASVSLAIAALGRIDFIFVSKSQRIKNTR